MQTREDMENELVTRLQVASNSTRFTSSRITELIQNATTWAGGLYVWNELVRGRRTSTVASQEYYDYPGDFRSETIIRVEIDDLEYDRKNFEDYLDFKKEFPNSTDRIFANYGRQYFVFPTPTSNGSGNLVVWGAVQHPALSTAETKTIFSDSNEQGNEAIVKKAFSVAIVRDDTALSKTEEAEAIAMLGKLRKTQINSTQRNQRLNHPMFQVPDYNAGRGSASAIGNFSINQLP